MKKLKVITLLVVILGFSSNNVIAQDVKTQVNASWYFDSNNILSLTACLGERVTGTVNCQGWYLTNGKYFNYHEVEFGVLFGEDGIADYTLEGVANQHWIVIDKIGFNTITTIPMVLKHKGKLVAVIHEKTQFIYHFGDENPIVDRWQEVKVECH
jgi:hypothetical protein